MPEQTKTSAKIAFVAGDRSGEPAELVRLLKKQGRGQPHGLTIRMAKCGLTER